MSAPGETPAHFFCGVISTKPLRMESPMDPVTAPIPLAPEDLGGPALRAFFKVAAAWGLRPAEARRLLGDPPESTFYKWKKQQDGAPGRDVAERISYVLGIFKALQ